MDKRLLSAYDKMTMPDGCSQRIEQLLLEGTKIGQKQRNQVILRPKSRWQTWGTAAALVCLAVIISLSGVMVFLGLEQQRGNLPRFSQSTEHREKPGDFPLSDSGEGFLLKMCQAMPDWESYYVLNDDFWEEFLYYSFTNPEKVADGKAETIIGELPFEDNAVLLSRKQAEDYAKLTMGCDLPLPKEEQSGRIQYADGIYRIPRTGSGSRLYRFRGLEEENQEECIARFDVYGGQPGKKLGTVAMKLRVADNENGFLIVNKTTEWEISEEPIIRAEERDEVGLLTGEPGFQMDVREGENFTARQIYLSHEDYDVREMLSSELFFGYEYTEDDANVLYQLKDGSWERTEWNRVTKVHREDGKEFSANIPYVEMDGIPYTPYSNGFDGGYVERTPHRNPYRVVYTWDQQVTEELFIVDGPWRLDFTTGEMADLWGNVPEEDRRDGINNNLSMIAFFRDGSFLIPCVERTEPYTRSFLYVDPEKGQVYDLEDLCGSELDDFVPVGEEIFCWKEGAYWRIPRDTMRPEYLGKTEYDVVLASGIWKGEWASFAVMQLPDGSYQVFDYAGNRVFTLGELGESGTWEVSPDGRKLLLPEGVYRAEVLDCDRGKLVTIDRELGKYQGLVDVFGNEVSWGWAESGEVCIGSGLWRNTIFYELK